jgi:hypothetical protein
MMGKRPRISDLIHLACDNSGVVLRHLLTSEGLVVDLTIVLVRIAVSAAEDVLAAAREAGEAHLLAAHKATCAVLLRRLLLLNAA